MGIRYTHAHRIKTQLSDVALKEHPWGGFRLLLQTAQDGSRTTDTRTIKELYLRETRPI